MKYLWNITIDDFLEVCERAKANGKKSGDSMEEEFLEVMKEKGIKHSCATELTKEELIKEYKSHGKSVLNVETDKQGNTNFKVENET
jgi:hypothetical protein